VRIVKGSIAASNIAVIVTRFSYRRATPKPTSNATQHPIMASSYLGKMIERKIGRAPIQLKRPNPKRFTSRMVATIPNTSGADVPPVRRWKTSMMLEKKPIAARKRETHPKNP